MYAILIISLLLVLGTLKTLQNRKTIIDKVKSETVDALEINNYQELLSKVEQLENGIVNKIYPVGSIYISIDNTKTPSELFGGTWVQLKDRFLLGAGDTYTSGSTGGEASHLLTNNELPANMGSFSALNWNSLSIWNVTTGIVTITTRTTDRTMSSGSYVGESTYNFSGGNQAHNNMPPYLTVYMWKRTS